MIIGLIVIIGYFVLAHYLKETKNILLFLTVVSLFLLSVISPTLYPGAVKDMGSFLFILLTIWTIDSVFDF